MRVTGVVLAALLAAAGAAAEPDPLQAHVQEARKAHERKDYAAMLEHTEAAAKLAPRSTRLRYNLACAHALLGHEAEAVAALGALADLGVYLEASKDADFAGLAARPAFQAVLARLEALKTPLGRSEEAFRLAEKDLVPEGIVYDSATRAFLLSSVHKRKVVRVAADHTAKDLVPPAGEGLMAALGMGLDVKRRTLWVASAAVPEMSGYTRDDEGKTALFAFDADSGRLRRKLPPPKIEGRQSLNDVLVAPDGTVYVSDSRAGALYVLKPGAEELQVWLAPGTLASPQGMALAGDGASLLVADYGQGLFRVALDTREATLLEPPADAALGGLDGLVAAPGGAVAIQNGLQPHRVLRLTLDGAKVAAARVLQRAHPLFDEPTLGVLVGGEFYYVANSQWSRFDQGRIWPLERLAEPVVLRVALE